MAQNTKDESDTDVARPSLLAIGLLVVLAVIVLVFGLSFYADDGESDVADTQSTSTDEGAAANDDEAADDSEPTSASADTTVEETDESYQYVAGNGESFTALARRSIAATDASLSTAERVAAETKLAQDADAGLLAVGEAVRLDKSTVQAAIDWASSLSADQKAAWQPYADLVAW